MIVSPSSWTIQFRTVFSKMDAGIEFLRFRIAWTERNNVWLMIISLCNMEFSASSFIVVGGGEFFFLSCYFLSCNVKFFDIRFGVGCSER